MDVFRLAEHVDVFRLLCGACRCAGRRVTPVLALLLLVAALPQTGRAEEGGSGHYFPGTISSFMDGVSPTEVFILRLNALHYDGSFGADRAVPIAGLAALDADVKSSAVGLTFFWRPSWGGIGERWSYAMSATVPFLRVEVSADVSVPGRSELARRTDTESGLGDIVLSPLMLNYHVSDDLNVNGRLNVYAPTGDYEVGRLANLGKNYWTFEPTLGFMYLGKENGREASIFFGAGFNTENTDTDYRTGTQLHVDGTLAQRLPLWKGLIGLGVTGYWYQQVEGDSGSGATFGSFEARTNGVGPSLTYSRAFARHRLAAELKWVHELGVRRRPEGNTFVLKAMLTF
jgi:hypothetical protein